jgi:hypothetical protein
LEIHRKIILTQNVMKFVHFFSKVIIYVMLPSLKVYRFY